MREINANHIHYIEYLTIIAGFSSYSVHSLVNSIKNPNKHVWNQPR